MDRHIIENTLIPHRAFEEATARISQCFDFSLNSHEPTCIALIGESRTGKSRVIQEFLAKHPTVRTDEGLTIPILKIETPAKPTVKGVVGLMLRTMGEPWPDTGTEIARTVRLKRLLRACQTRMLILEEFQHFIDKGSLAVAHHLADWLKVLVDDTNVMLVVCGLPRGLAVIKQNEQLEGRFLAPIEMRRFDWRVHEHRSEFAAITVGFERSIREQLDVPALGSAEMAFRLCCASGGLIGYLAKLLRQLVWNALASRRTFATLEDFDAAHRHAVDWPEDIPRPFSPTFITACDEATLAGLYASIGVEQVPFSTRPKIKARPAAYKDIFRTKS